jgi:uncharacterized damage-inducible protein DinB
MPGVVPPVSNERENLLGYIAQQRDAIRTTAFGLTEEQARQAPSASELTIAGLVKHVAMMERHWIGIMLQRSEGGSESAYLDSFTLEPGETLASVLALYDEVARETDEAVAGIEDLGRAVPVPQGVPWFPADVEAWSVRWVLLHVVEETARHAGHADIVRESIDGATFYPLMAAAEGWPASPWLQPWEPPAAR